MNTAAPDLPSLDGRQFVMESSTASVVDATSPSRFWYFERDGVVWGHYVGDTVTFGRFLGRRVGNELTVNFVHVLAATGLVVPGASSSSIRWGEGDTIRLVESFLIAGEQHASVCVELISPPAAS